MFRDIVQKVKLKPEHNSMLTVFLLVPVPSPWSLCVTAGFDSWVNRFSLYLEAMSSFRNEHRTRNRIWFSTKHVQRGRDVTVGSILNSNTEWSHPELLLSKSTDHLASYQIASASSAQLFLGCAFLIVSAFENVFGYCGVWCGGNGVYGGFSISDFRTSHATGPSRIINPAQISIEFYNCTRVLFHPGLWDDGVNRSCIF